MEQNRITANPYAPLVDLSGFSWLRQESTCGLRLSFNKSGFVNVSFYFRLPKNVDALASQGQKIVCSSWLHVGYSDLAFLNRTRSGGGSIFEHFFVYHCHGLSRPPVEVVGFAHLAKQTHEGGLGRKQQGVYLGVPSMNCTLTVVFLTYLSQFSN